MRGVLIYNPAAGRRTGPPLDALLSLLGRGVEAVATGAPGEATEIARRAAHAGAEAVFVLGGDGTQREAATGILDTPCALGPLPGGTTNVVAGALGLGSRSVLRAAKRLAGSRPIGIDVGLCDDAPFLMQASCGLDAAILAAVSPALKRWGGRFGVVLGGLGTWWRYRHPAIDLQLDGRRIEGVTLAVAANLARYAGPFRIVPGASCRDGRLDVLLFRGRSRASVLGLALGLVGGRHLLRPDVEVVAAEEVLFRGGAPMQLDGDPLPESPQRRVRLAAGRLRVLLPEGVSVESI